MKRRHVTCPPMAVLLNQTSNLRLRIELLRRISDGTTRPASLEMRAAVDRYQHRPGGERGADLALYRFAVNKRAALAFCAGLIEEFERFPTDPSAVSPGEPA